MRLFEVLLKYSADRMRPEWNIHCITELWNRILLISRQLASPIHQMPECSVVSNDCFSRFRCTTWFSFRFCLFKRIAVFEASSFNQGRSSSYPFCRSKPKRQTVIAHFRGRLRQTVPELVFDHLYSNTALARKSHESPLPFKTVSTLK
jgi:hypothetical protein